MVATPTMRDELIKHGFRNISPWTRGVDTDLFHPRLPGEPDVFEGLARPIWLNVGRIAVEKNIENFLALDLPGTKVLVGDGPQREELAEKYPQTVVPGPALRRGSGRPLCLRRRLRLPLAHRHLRPGDPRGHGDGHAGGRLSRAGADRHPAQSGAGKLAATCEDGLREACLDALKLDRTAVRAYAERFSWRSASEEFVRNLQPYPEPEKTRFWRKLRRLARLRRRPAA